MRRWLVKPIYTQKVIVQLGQGISTYLHLISSPAVFSPLWLFSFSWVIAPLCKAVRHSLQLCAVSFQVSGFTLKDMRDPFNVFLYRFLGPPRERFLCWCSLNSSFLESSRLSRIRACVLPIGVEIFFQAGVDTGESSTGQDLCIRDFVLPFYPE